MSSIGYSYLAVAGAIAALIVPSWQIITKSHTKWYKRVTPIGWVLFCVAVFIGLVSLLGIKASNEEQQIAKKQTDSLMDANRDSIIASIQNALKPFKLKYNDTSKTIIRDTVLVLPSIRSQEPLLVVNTDLPIYATVKYKGEDKYEYSLSIKNIRNATAYFIENYMFILVDSVGEHSLNGAKPIDYSNELQSLIGMHGFTLGYPFFANKLPDTTFLYTKMVYKDSVGKKQPAFRTMYILTPDLINQQLIEVNSNEFQQIKDYLKRVGGW